MGCFEDFEQFRDEVDQAKKKIQAREASSQCRCRDMAKKEEDLVNLEVKTG